MSVSYTHLDVYKRQAFIWKNLDESKSKEELVDKIMDEFEVDEETARTDVEGFVGALYEHCLLYTSCDDHPWKWK